MDQKTADKMLSCAIELGITSDKVAENYSALAENYNEISDSGGYIGPKIAANEVAARISEDKRGTLKVIDVGAGTGRVGRLLKDKGFLNIDALEPSKGMMDILKKTGVYTNTYSEFLGVGQNSVLKDTYDILVTAGSFAPGHIPVKGIDDMIRITKTGGFVIIVMRKEFLDQVEEYKDRLIPYMDEMERRGKWIKEKVDIIPEYMLNREGILFTYKVV